MIGFMATARRAAVIGGIALAAAAAAIGAWRWRAAPPAPPAPADRGEIDPLALPLIEGALAEVSEAPWDAARRARLAMVYQANGLHALAAACWEQTLSLDARRARWWYHLAAARGDLGDPAGAAEAARRAIALDGTHAPAHARLGSWLEQLGRHEEAEAAFRRCGALDPASAAGWMGMARMLAARGEHSAAVELIRQEVIPRWPEYGDAHRIAGLSLRKLGRAEEARTELSHTHGLVPPASDSWHDDVMTFVAAFGPTLKRADALIESGRAREALELLARLPESRRNADLLNKVAEAHFALRQPQRALQELQAAARLDPRHLATQLNLSHGFEQTGRTDLALRHADAAIALNPASGPAHLQKGRLLLLERRNEEALPTLLEAVRLGSGDRDVLTMLGELESALSLWVEAGETFERVLGRYPDHGPAIVGLARARAELGDHDSAASLLEQAMKLAPQDPDLAAVAARIRQLRRSAPR
jgi:tetratricopeptide (TPR) repeat protein